MIREEEIPCSNLEYGMQTIRKSGEKKTGRECECIKVCLSLF